jgi:MoxR-like ATPase
MNTPVDVVAAGRPLIDCIKQCYAANRSPLLVGRHGVGKSAVLAQAARELGIGYISRDLSLMEPPDLVGMPRLDGKVTRYLPPAFLPTKGRGLIVFEELNRCPNYMRAPVLQLLTDRSLNDYRLPPGWLPAAAINPPDGDYSAEDLDPAYLSRFTRFWVVPDRDEWLRWARAQELHEAVTDYVDHNPEVFDMEADWRNNPRAWKYVSDHLLAWQRLGGALGGTPTPLAAPLGAALEAAIAGEVGPANAVRFRDFREGRGEALPRGEDVLTDYGRYQKQVREWRDGGKLDRLEALVHEVRRVLLGDEEYARDGERLGNLTKFLADLPPDQATRLRAWLEGYEYDVPAVTQPRKRRRP